MKFTILLILGCISSFAQGLSVSSSYVSLSGKTNQVTDSGSALLFNGASIGVDSWNLLNLSFLYGQGAYYTNLYFGNLASGTSDLFTVPTGMRLSLAPGISVSTTNLSSTAYNGTVKISGNYYIIPNNSTATTNSPSAGAVYGANNSYIFEAGEIVAITTSVTGANVWMSGLLFPNTAPLKTVKILSFTGGNDLVYTVPTGYTAFSPDNATSSGRTTSLLWTVINASGSQRTVGWHMVPSGSSVDGTTILKNGPFPNNTSNGLNANIPSNAPAGTAFYVTSDASTATQWSFITVYERLNP